MVWVRMMLVALRLAWPSPLAPWRSPLLRWRMETYGMLDERGHPLHAEDITARRFLQFTLRHRAALLRFCRWAALL